MFAKRRSPSRGLRFAASFERTFTVSGVRPSGSPRHGCRPRCVLSVEKQKGPDSFESGPLLAELGGCAPMRLPLPDASDRPARYATAGTSNWQRPAAWTSRSDTSNRRPPRTGTLRRRVQTHHDPCRVEGFVWRRIGSRAVLECVDKNIAGFSEGSDCK